MKTLEKINSLTEELNLNVTKFYGGNKSAGTRARKTLQDIRNLAKDTRDEISNTKKEMVGA